MNNLKTLWRWAEVIGEEYSRLKEECSLGFKQLRAKMCLDYILRKHFFQIHICSKTMSKVICLTAISIGMIIQFLSAFNDGHDFVASEGVLAIRILEIYCIWNILYASTNGRRVQGWTSVNEYHISWNIHKCFQFVLGCLSSRSASNCDSFPDNHFLLWLWQWPTKVFRTSFCWLLCMVSSTTPQVPTHSWRLHQGLLRLTFGTAVTGLPRPKESGWRMMKGER